MAREAGRMRGLSRMHQTGGRTRQARRLRSEATTAEAALWTLLRGRRFEGLKFRRQTPVAGAIVDFFCAELRLVVELDGGIHRLREAEDGVRDLKLARSGFTIVRFDNEPFLRNPNIVLEAIRRHAIGMRKQPPHPSGSA